MSKAVAGCQMVCTFSYQKSQFAHILEDLGMENVYELHGIRYYFWCFDIFVVIWYILWPFVAFVVIW
jgi:hypothetical protein